MYRELENKVAIVTGGSKGIGNAIAKRFGKEKMSVLVNYNTDADGAKSAVEEIEKNGGKAFAVQADLSSDEGAKKLLDAALEQFGDIDVWVNNAGIQSSYETDKLPLSEWKKIIDTNLTGVFIGTQTALSYFIENDKKGNIINMSSVHEKIPWPTFTHYAAAKGGVKLLTESVAMEYAPNKIRINAIGPGAINTPINAKKFEDKEALATTSNMIPMARVGKPEEVAAVAAWLASDESSYVTGQTLFVDGGMTLYPSFKDGNG